MNIRQYQCKKSVMITVGNKAKHRRLQYPRAAYDQNKPSVPSTRIEPYKPQSVSHCEYSNEQRSITDLSAAKFLNDVPASSHFLETFFFQEFAGAYSQELPDGTIRAVYLNNA